jgi:undecaprenyl-diphosphatase
MGRTRALYAALGLYLSLSLVVAVGAVLVFAEVAEDVLEGDTQKFDEAGLRWIRAGRAPWLDHAALEVTALGSGVVMCATTLLVSVLLWQMAHRRHVALIWIAGLGALPLGEALKAVFGRPRPDIAAAVEVSSLSFPSGHAINVVVFYTVMAFVVGRLVEARWGRTAVHVFGALVILLVGWTRVYLGVHYPSDVAAGYAVGYAWAISCCILVEARTRTRQASPRPSPAG